MSNSTSNGALAYDSTLVGEFEATYAALVAPLTSEDHIFDRNNEPFKIEDDKISNFMDVARNLENFFLQRRQWIYAHKPELILREDTLELKQELARKDELIRRHFDKLGQWQDLLQDMQSSGPSGSSGVPGTSAGPGPSGSQASGPSDIPKVPGAAPPRGATPIVPPNVAPGAPMQPGVGAPQGGFVPGNNYRMQQPGISPSGGLMQDPLSYLERTATSVGNSMTR